jgi:hypothetical protein
LPPDCVPGYLGRLSDQPGARQRRVCPACEGKGSIRKPGDPHARDLVLEMTGMTGKRRDVAARFTYNFAASYEQLSKVTFDVGPVEEIIEVAPESSKLESSKLE